MSPDDLASFRVRYAQDSSEWKSLTPTEQEALFNEALGLIDDSVRLIYKCNDYMTRTSRVAKMLIDLDDSQLAVEVLETLASVGETFTLEYHFHFSPED